jgi:predicted transcriptional regulator
MYEIFAEILETCRRPQNKTHVMYNMNTSYDSITKYLQQLQEMRLLQVESGTRSTFKMTDRDQESLEKGCQLQNLLSNDKIPYNLKRFVAAEMSI